MLTVLFLLFVAEDVTAADSVVEEIVCKVNGDVITRSELQRLSGELGKDALRQRIDELLLLQQARQLNFSADADLTRRIAEIQAQNSIADPEKLREFIEEQAGMKFEDFRERLRNQYLMARVVGEQVERTIVIADAEKRKYYDEHKSEFVRKDEITLGQIFVPENTAAAAAATRARELAARGAFPEVVTYARGELRPELEAIVFAHKRGYVTDLIHTAQGFLVLKVLERQEPGQALYEDVAGEIGQRLAAPRAAAKLRGLLTRLRQEAFLQIREGYVDSGAAPGKDTSWHDAPVLAPATITKQELESRRKK
jgi:parvulin-like peptidyl-prolyl isomerase